MKSLSLIVGLIQFFTQVMIFLREKELISAGYAQAVAAALSKQSKDLYDADYALAHVDDELRDHPDRLRDKDPGSRD